MNEPVLLAIAVKAIGTAAFVLGMAVVIDRAPPIVAAAAIGVPVVIGPGFFIVAVQQPTAFLVATAGDAVPALLGTLAFMVVIGRLFDRLGTGALLIVGLGAWAVVALAVTAVDVALPIALAGLALAFAASHLVLPFRRIGSAMAKSGRRPAPYGRALQAGLFVALVTWAADRLGERLTAVLLAMPVAMVFLTLTLKARAVPGIGPEVYRWARIGLVPILSFVLTVRLTAATVGNVPAVLLAVLVSIAVSTLIALARQRRAAMVAVP